MALLENESLKYSPKENKSKENKGKKRKKKKHPFKKLTLLQAFGNE